jgi:mycothiol synthase
MDASRYRLREFEDRDFPALAELRHRVDPERKASVEELRHSDELQRRPPKVYEHFAIEDRTRGVAVAFGRVFTDSDTMDTKGLWADVAVDPDHRGRGLGRTLSATAVDRARAAGATSLFASARASDPRALAFFEVQGFRERRRRWWSRLALPAPAVHAIPRPTAALRAAGFSFTTLAEEGADRVEVRQALHGVFSSILADEPRIGQYQPPDFATFQADMFEGPGFLPEAFLLAKQGEEWVGVCVLERAPDEPGVLHQMLTGTVRAARGRGVATELKVRSVEFGERAGFRAIRTSNDSQNYPMWAINEKLGFRRELVRIEGEKPLGGPAPDPAP